jgi:hypothetical protein
LNDHDDELVSVEKRSKAFASSLPRSSFLISSSEAGNLLAAESVPPGVLPLVCVELLGK